MICAWIDTSSADTASSAMTSLGLWRASGRCRRAGVGRRKTRADSGRHAGAAARPAPGADAPARRCPAILDQSMDDDGFGDAVPHRMAGVEGGEGILEDILDVLAQMAPLRRIHRGHVASREANGSARRRDELLQGSPDRRFAAAGFADQGEGLARKNVEADALDRVDPMGHAAEQRLRDVEAPRQVLDLEKRSGIIARCPGSSGFPTILGAPFSMIVNGIRTGRGLPRRLPRCGTAESSARV